MTSLEPHLFDRRSWPHGELTLVAGSRGLVRLYFGSPSPARMREDLIAQGRPALRLELLSEGGRGSAAQADLLRHALSELDQYLGGARKRLRAPVDLTAVTPFRQRVLQCASRIPLGATCTYGELARKVDSPSAARAVGGAMGNNPVPIFVPCHRVVAGGGKMGGFSGGLSLKRTLLALEGAAPALH